MLVSHACTPNHFSLLYALADQARIPASRDVVQKLRRPTPAHWRPHTLTIVGMASRTSPPAYRQRASTPARDRHVLRHLCQAAARKARGSIPRLWLRHHQLTQPRTLLPDAHGESAALF